MLSNAYFLAKFRFDTAENEPTKNLQNFRKMHFRKIHFQDNAREEDYDEAMSDTTAHTEKPLNKDDDSDVEEDSMSLP